MQIWDTAGQERFRSVHGLYYLNADGCLLVYDIGNLESFQALNKWKEEFLNTIKIDNEDAFPFVLLGNKSDVDTKSKDEVKSKRAVIYIQH